MTISKGVGGQQQSGGGGSGQTEVPADNQNFTHPDINVVCSPSNPTGSALKSPKMLQEPQPGFSENFEVEMGDPPFPHAKLAMLEDKVSSPRWVVPVLPEQELECLLLASIDLCKKG
jgi:hypothetical protein